MTDYSKDKKSRKFFLVWPQEYELSRSLAKKLGLKLVLIQAKKQKLPFILRYLDQSRRTFSWLKRNQPDFIMIQNPPLMACLIVFFYSLAHPQIKIGTDNHSVLFRSRKWRLFHFLFKPVAKRAIINTAHNKYDLRLLKRWNVACQEMQFINPSYKKSLLETPLKNMDWEKKIEQAEISVFMVNRFAKKDDDYATVLEAATRKPDWIFFITGDFHKINQKKINKAPSNVIFTGYLEHEEFLRLMGKCQMALCLTLREKTILWSIREALALRKVFVTSATEALKNYFSEVGIFSERKNPSDLIQKIQYAIKHERDYQEKIERFLEKDSARIEKEIRGIKNII
jgi:glycosyltransferase involved in cell wall biosynthesis